MTWQFDLTTAIGGRAEQQDRVAHFALPGRRGGHLLVVADGMGGQQQGALAAQTVIDTAEDALPTFGKGNPRETLTDFCRVAHEAIRDIGLRNATNPASTCTALYLRGDEAYWVHVGDSRLYHFNHDKLLFRTDDHTLAALLQGNGGRAATRRRDSRLYMCLGGLNDLEPTFGATAVGRHDWFLLCSDGFWSQVSSDEAMHGVNDAGSEETAADVLAALAAQRGGPRGDNISVAIATRAAPAPRLAWWRR